MAVKDWHTHYPGAQDVISTDQPDLDDDVPPIVGDDTRSSQIETIRDKAQSLAGIVGSNLFEAGTLRKKVYDLEAVIGDATKIQGRAIDSAAPSDQECLIWNDSLSQWEPGIGSANAVQIQGRTVIDTAPNDQDALIWNDTESRWEPGLANAKLLQGRAIDASAPVDMESLIWNESETRWEPGIGSANAVKIQGRDVDSADPDDGQVLTWNDAGGRWEPGDVSTTDEKVKVSATDTTAAYLTDKIVGANGVAKTILNPGVNEQIQLSPTYGSSTNTVCQGDDSRLSDDRTASGLRSATTIVGVSAATAPSAGQVLTASSSTVATWQTPVLFLPREQEFTATGGDQTFTLSATPAVNANTLSGRNILGVFRNGARLRYQATPTLSVEFGFTAPTSIVCKNLTAGDIITVVYGS